MIFAKRNLPLFSSVDTEKSRDSKEQGRIFVIIIVCLFVFSFSSDDGRVVVVAVL